VLPLLFALPAQVAVLLVLPLLAVPVMLPLLVLMLMLVLELELELVPIMASGFLDCIALCRCRESGCS
jgi:hypothetical protein